MEQIHSVIEFQKSLSWYTQYSEKYFRGQGTSYPTISPSISRKGDYLLNETQINQETLQLAYKDFEQSISPLEKLAKMQHYGIPTRLIDVTVDPLVALFFAVSDIESGTDGYVYMFIKDGRKHDHIEVKLLSLLAFLPDYKVSTIQREYLKEFGEEITEDLILKYVSTTAFIKQELLEGNERLERQLGTFAICGNAIKEKTIQQRILNLEEHSPTMTFRIPFEYKGIIKEELDKKGYNITTMYPDLPTVALYLKEKYATQVKDISLAYRIVDVDKTILYAGRVKRVSINIILRDNLLVQDIKRISQIIKEDWKNKANIIFLYFARNEKDFISKNFMIRGQWVSPNLPSNMAPRKWSEPDDTGYQWVENLGYAVRGDFYSENIFKANKELYVRSIDLFNQVKVILKELVSMDNNIEKMKQAALERENEFQEIQHKSSDIGLSEDETVNEYLGDFNNAMSLLDNVFIYLTRSDYQEQRIQYQINKLLAEIKEIVFVLELRIGEVVKDLKITAEDCMEYSNETSEVKYIYDQSLPIEADALEVVMSFSLQKNEAGHVKFIGKTNLFDDASLLVRFGGSVADKVTVEKGMFETPFFSKQGNGFLPGKYKIEISLSIPRTQSKTFVEKAGIEYERMTGPLIDREGLGPTLKFSGKVNL